MTATSEISKTTTMAELAPVLSDRYALRWQHVAVCTAFVGLFVAVNHMPLSHLGLWQHVSLGRWILQHQVLPTSDPLQPLADGMPLLSTAWLAQITFALLEAWGGAAMLSNLLAVVVLGTAVVWARVFFLATRQKRFALLGVGAILAVAPQQLVSLEPAALGGLCLAVLVWLLFPAGVWNRRAGAGQPVVDQALRSLAAWRWVAISGLMALWANLDGSFVVGMILLGCLGLGRTVEVVWSLRSAKAVFEDSEVRRWVWLVELAALATLLNPQGLRLWGAAIWHTAGPVWQQQSGWRPLQLTGWLGIGFVCLWVVTMILLRHSRAAVRPADVLMLSVAGVLAACHEGFVCWFAPLAVLAMMPHLADIADRRGWRAEVGEQDTQPGSAAEPWKFAWSLVCLLLVWCGFALSPISSSLLSDKPRTADRLYGGETPMAVSGHLRELRPQNLVWAPDYWSDWLVWDSGGALPMFATSNLRQLPRQVQGDYVRLYRGDETWQKIADRYNVGTLVLDKRRQQHLSSLVMRSPDKWRLVFENERAQILQRKGA